MAQALAQAIAKTISQKVLINRDLPVETWLLPG